MKLYYYWTLPLSLAAISSVAANENANNKFPAAVNDSLRGGKSTSPIVVEKQQNAKHDNDSSSSSSSSVSRSLQLLEPNEMECWSNAYSQDPDDMFCTFRVKASSIGPKGVKVSHGCDDDPSSSSSSSSSNFCLTAKVKAVDNASQQQPPPPPVNVVPGPIVNNNEPQLPPGIPRPCFPLPPQAVCTLTPGYCVKRETGVIFDVCCPDNATGTYQPDETCFVNNNNNNNNSNDDRSPPPPPPNNDEDDEPVIIIGRNDNTGNVGTGGSCNDSSDCIETTYCASNKVCISMNSCHRTEDCYNPSNSLLVKPCPGESDLYCKGVICDRKCK